MANKFIISKKVLQKISQRIQNGETTIRQSAREFGCHHNTMKIRLQERNLPIVCIQLTGAKNKNWRSKLSIKSALIAIKRVQAGETYTSVCKEFGVQICDLRRMGIRLGIRVDKQRPASPFKCPNSITDLAYIAGLLDGEGCISPPWTGHTYAVTIHNTYKPVIDWLGTFGGFIYSHQPSAFGRKLQYTWRLNARSCVETLIRKLFPYLKIKRQKAIQAIQFYRRKRKCARGDYT